MVIFGENFRISEENFEELVEILGEMFQDFGYFFGALCNQGSQGSQWSALIRVVRAVPVSG